MKKIYILDTNILLSDPRAIFGFDDNHVVITQTTLQELDSKKNAMGELGYNAREAIRTIESLRKDADNNDVTNETKLETGGTFQVVPDDTEYLPSTFSKERPDNRIIGTALYLQKLKKSVVVLVTNDVSMRINASAAHFNDVEEYRNDHVPKDSENYTGIYTYDCDTKSGKELIQALESNFLNGLSIEDVSIIGGIDFTGHEFHENEFAVFKCEQRDVVTIYRHGSLYIVNLKDKVFGVQPKNVHQIAALHALSAPVQDIPLVILKGAPGSAKTFLSLAAGLDTTFNSMYHKVLISRNNVMADAEFGFLPGSINEKMTPLLAPFYDNLENLYRNYEPNESDEEINGEIDDLFESKKIDICPLAYMRGRSITHSYLIVDEVQNATRSQIRDIITRAGEGTKIVLCGDPGQVDAHNLDRYNNGLVFAAQRFIDSPLCAQITFTSDTCVRSELAKEASNLLQF